MAAWPRPWPRPRSGFGPSCPPSGAAADPDLVPSLSSFPARVADRDDPGPGGGSMRTLITNGTIVTADGSTAADVLIDGERVARIGSDLASDGVTADETIDAAGRWLIPGAIDVHTHIELPFVGNFAH